MREGLEVTTIWVPTVLVSGAGEFRSVQTNLERVYGRVHVTEDRLSDDAFVVATSVERESLGLMRDLSDYLVSDYVKPFSVSVLQALHEGRSLL